MSNESIKSRKYYRVHNGESWDRMHFVTDANSVDANDGDTMETKVGAIKGITTSTEVTEEGYAADATVVAALNSSLGGLRFGTDGDGNYGYYGADDSLIPFSNVPILFTFYPRGVTGLNGKCNGSITLYLIKGTEIYGLENLTVESENYVDGVITEDSYVTFVTPTQTGASGGTYLIGVEGKCLILSPNLNSLKNTTVTMTYGCTLGYTCALDCRFSFCFQKNTAFTNMNNIKISGHNLVDSTLSRTCYITCDATTYKYPNGGSAYIEKTSSFDIV